MAKINFHYSPDVTLEQMIGYEMASVIWGKLFTDNIDVNILAKSTNTLDANVIGGAVPEFHEQHYALFLQYFQADITSAEDQQAYDALQQGNTVDFLLNGDLVGGNTKLKLSTALAKALGMTEAISLDRYVLDDTANYLDGTIMMNQSFAWDFNYTREVAAAENTLDFLSVALHETGHILGFTSSIDFSLQQDTLYSGRTELSNFSPLDLFRFSAESIATENPDGVVGDLSIGGVAWFSPNGGETLTAKMSTGKTGDGYQASHWERRYDPLGIMDPTLWYQERAVITDLDALAFDIIGYDLSPDAANVEQLFTTEGLALSLAEAKVNLASKLGVTVQWLEDNANVPVSSLDLIAQFETAAAESSTTNTTTTDSSTTESGTTDSSTTNTTTTESSKLKDFLEKLGDMMKDRYKEWSKNSDSNNYAENSSNQESSSSQNFYEWWSQNNGGKSSSWQELYEWWAQNNGGKSSSWQELYEWWAQNNGGKSSSWQELYEWWAQDNGGKSSWWQEVFFASTDETTNLDAIALPGEQTNTVDAIYKDITGGMDDDIIAGDISNDNILGEAGDDLIDGAEGDDTISGGDGFDTIFGFDGNDSISGGDGDDVISGESDNDVLLGEAGSDILFGGDHDDYLDGGTGNDFLNGNNGHDVLVGRSGKDALEGEAGKDLLIGGSGQDIGNGGSGDDLIFGDEYSDSLQKAFGTNVNSLISLFTPGEEIEPETQTTETNTNNEPVIEVVLAEDPLETENVVLAQDPVRLEAEDMSWSGDYKVEQKTYASGGELVGPNADNQWISGNTTFNEQSGTYNIIIGYHDIGKIGESKYNDGQIKVKVNGNEIDSWTLDDVLFDAQLMAENFAKYTINNVQLNQGDTFGIDSLADFTPEGFIDYIEFVKVETSPNTDTTNTTNTTSTTNTNTTNTTNTSSGVLQDPNSDILRGGNGNDGIDGGEGNDVIFGENEYNDSSNIAPLNIDGSFTYGQTTYILTEEAMSWTEAQLMAESYGGNLVTINDAAEEQWLNETFGSQTFHTGFTSSQQWVSGEELTYKPITHYVVEQTTIKANNGKGNNKTKIKTETKLITTEQQSLFGIIEIDWSSVGGNDTVFGGAGNDQIYGNSGNDLLYGDYAEDNPTAVEQGHDQIIGNGGNDTIYGGAGDDLIEGTDQIVAGYYENDVLIGGTGADKFILGDANQAYYATEGNQDYAVIKDFDSSVDTIQFFGSAVDYQAQLQGNDMFVSRNGDLVAILENTNSVNLSGTAFKYVP